MKVFVWRQNKTYHSHSMIQEPCLNNEFYLDIVAVVAADDLEEALAVLDRQQQGWRIEDLRLMEPQVFTLEEAKVIFTDIRG